MLILRIRQAEVALADDRLEEAYELARRPDVRAHRRGQQLATRLVEALVVRGRSHLAAARPTEALRAAEMARALGGAQAHVAALIAEAGDAVTAAQRQAHRRHALPPRVRQAMNGGDLSHADALVQRGAELSLSMTDAADELAQRRRRAEAAINRARAALERGELDEALTGLSQARTAHATSDALAELTQAVATALATAVDDELARGRIGQAEVLLSRAEPWVQDDHRLAEQRRAVSHCRAAAEAVEVGEWDEAAATLRRLRTLLPEADWLTRCLAQVDQARAARDALREGPLGGVALFDGDDADPGKRRTPPRRDPAPLSAPPTDPAPATTPLPACFYLQVDGGESVLVVRGERVVLGPVSGRGSVDVPLMLPPHTAPLHIEQSEDEHIATAEAGVVVNGERASRRPLMGGDRIAMGPRGSARYHRPHPASPTAVLELDGLRLGRPDVRRVVLLGGPLVIGAGPSAHVRASHLTEPIVLHERAGALWARLSSPSHQDGIAHPAGIARGNSGDNQADASIIIRPGQPARLGGANIEVMS